jgi:tripartite-type tricarboxylate transporter receptor subunit TctC
LLEAGGGADTLVPTYFALAAPAGTPPAIVARLNAEMKKALADPVVAERFIAAGLVPTGSSAESMTNTVKTDVPRFNALVKSIGIKPE